MFFCFFFNKQRSKILLVVNKKGLNSFIYTLQIFYQIKVVSHLVKIENKWWKDDYFSVKTSKTSVDSVCRKTDLQSSRVPIEGLWRSFALLSLTTWETEPSVRRFFCSEHRDWKILVYTESAWFFDSWNTFIRPSAAKAI